MNLPDATLARQSGLALAADEVQVWQVNLATVADGETPWEKVLSKDEIERANRFHFPKDRKRFVVTRGLLRKILAGYLSSDAAKLVFRYSPNNKPSLETTGHSKVEFNVSHSGSMALLAFARGRELGVDIEMVPNDIEHESIARRFFSAHEQAQLAALPAPERRAGFFRCWTRKEAYVKACGSGLSLPLDQFDVSLKPEDENALLATRPDPAEARRWSLREIPMGQGYIAALCVRGYGWQLRV